MSKCKVHVPVGVEMVLISNNEKILRRAYDAANQAIRAEIARCPEDINAFDCGFAWVDITPANSPFVNWLKSQIALCGGERAPERHRFGRKGFPSGWRFWCPGDFNGQSVRIIECGARAFCRALETDGIIATWSSRLD